MLEILDLSFPFHSFFLSLERSQNFLPILRIKNPFVTFFLDYHFHLTFKAALCTTSFKAGWTWTVDFNNPRAFFLSAFIAIRT